MHHCRKFKSLRLSSLLACFMLIIEYPCALIAIVFLIKTSFIPHTHINTTHLKRENTSITFLGSTTLLTPFMYPNVSDHQWPLRPFSFRPRSALAGKLFL
ncbi:hypothetical protein F5Y16DRAFT_371744, partial [Xylariaceae sp. FL0255]